MTILIKVAQSEDYLSMTGSWSKVLIIQFFLSFCASRSLKEENFELNIIHMNDVHAHFDEISLNAGENNFKMNLERNYLF